MYIYIYTHISKGFSEVDSEVPCLHLPTGCRVKIKKSSRTRFRMGSSRERGNNDRRAELGKLLLLVVISITIVVVVVVIIMLCNTTTNNNDDNNNPVKDYVGIDPQCEACRKPATPAA